MGGRNGNLNKTLRIRYKTDNKKIRSSLRFDGNPKRARRLFKGGRVLKITKVSPEERLHIGDFSPFEVESDRMQSAVRDQHRRNKQERKRQSSWVQSALAER